METINAETHAHYEPNYCSGPDHPSHLFGPGVHLRSLRLFNRPEAPKVGTAAGKEKFLHTLGPCSGRRTPEPIRQHPFLRSILSHSLYHVGPTGLLGNDP